MPIVRNVLSPVPRNRTVTVSLVAPAGWMDGGSSEATPISRWEARIDDNGEWSLEIPSQSAFVADGTWYRVSEPGVTHSIVVPDTSGPHDLYSLLVAPVPSSNYMVTPRMNQLADATSLEMVADGQSPVWNAGSNRWIPGSVAGISDHGLLSGLADNDHTQYQLLSGRGVPNGYPSLDAQGFVPVSQLPQGVYVEEGDYRLSSNEIYPLEGYGFHSATCSGESTNVQSPFSSWHVRVWVRAGKPVVKVAMVVTTAGVVGVGGLNAFSFYTDDAQQMIGVTPIMNDFWAATDLRELYLQSPIPASENGRFIRVLPNVDGYSSAPSVAYVVPVGNSGATINGPGIRRRSAFKNPYASSFPSSFDPGSLGTPTNFLPLILLG